MPVEASGGLKSEKNIFRSDGEYGSLITLRTAQWAPFLRVYLGNTSAHRIFPRPNHSAQSCISAGNTSSLLKLKVSLDSLTVD